MHPRRMHGPAPRWRHNHAMPSQPQPTPLSPSAPEPDLAQIEADLLAFQTHIQGMQRDRAALRRTMARAPRTHALALVLSLLVTGLAWWLALSPWLRYYVLPVTLGLVLLFTVGAWRIDRWMSGRLAQYQHLADTATAQLASARQAPTSPPAE